MTGRPSAEALDAELTRRVDEQARIAETLTELENHPGLRLLQSARPSGVTATRWAEVQQLLAKLWTDLATHRAVVADACAVRTRRPRPGEREWADLHELLMTPTAGASTTRVTVSTAERLTPRELAARMEARIREVAEVLDAVEGVHLAALSGLGPLVERLRDARAHAHDLLEPADPDATTLAALADAVDVRLAVCIDDPLSLPSRLPRDLVGGLDDGLDEIAARLADRAAARDTWVQRRRAVADAVAALDPLCEQECHARCEALHRVAGAALTAPDDPRPALRRRLAALPPDRPDAAALAELPRLAADTDAATDAVRHALERATGLTDRRTELAGRFAAYRAKSLRLGVSDDPRVGALAAQVRDLLATAPTDLQALTPALVAYQQRVNAAAEQRRPA